jgi:hypothetical protein
MSWDSDTNTRRCQRCLPQRPRRARLDPAVQGGPETLSSRQAEREFSCRSSGPDEDGASDAAGPLSAGRGAVEGTTCRRPTKAGRASLQGRSRNSPEAGRTAFSGRDRERGTSIDRAQKWPIHWPHARTNPAICRAFLSTATGIRTPVSAVRGRRPSPLDDSGGLRSWRVARAVRDARVGDPAAVAELVDAQASGACGGNPVEVRVLSAAYAPTVGAGLEMDARKPSRPSGAGRDQRAAQTGSELTTPQRQNGTTRGRPTHRARSAGARRKPRTRRRSPRPDGAPPCAPCADHATGVCHYFTSNGALLTPFPSDSTTHAL